MNLKITKEQHERLCSTHFNEYIFGSQLHGIASENSDEVFIRVYKDNIAMAFKDNYNVNRTLHENANYCARKFIEQLIK